MAAGAEKTPASDDEQVAQVTPPSLHSVATAQWCGSLGTP
jgi:hypothetical protein